MMHRAHICHIFLPIYFRFRGLVIGAPTYSNTLYPPVEALVQAIKTREVKNRIISTFGSYTWAPQAVKRINTLLEEGKNVSADITSVEARQAPDASVMEGCKTLADEMARRLADK